ncbi:MAG: ribonuclease J [Acidimicrobiales bacterium]
MTSPAKASPAKASPAKASPAKASPVKIVFLGGLGEIGRNCACVEVEGRIIIVDCGIMFPDADMPGVDLVLPDFSYILDNKGRVDACVLTHGHEDHTGGLAFLLRDIELDVYGSELTLGLARNRIEEAGLLGKVSFHPVVDGEVRRVGPIDVEFIPVTHSVPHGFAVALHTPQGVLLHTGDFKLDMTPIDGRRTDLARMGAIASEQGIRMLLSDSTNAEEEGHTDSEADVGGVLRELFGKAKDKRIIVTCFASHIHRVQQIVDAAIASGRKVATLGRSMAKNVALARSIGLLQVPDASLVDIEKVAGMAAEKVCVISTGSQGEPMSALSLMAARENKWVTLGEGDLVVISAHAIPGNETAVSKVIDDLHRAGADVVHAGLAPVHTSGHAMRGELATLLSVTRPEYFIPVHGEFRHLVHHANLARAMGVATSNVLICEDGDVVEISGAGADFAGEVPAGYLYVDGTVGDVGHGVLRDRRALAEEGMIVVVVTLDAHDGSVIAGPEIITKGWVFAKEAEPLLAEAKKAVDDAIAAARSRQAGEGAVELDVVRQQVRQAVGKIVAARTKRRPMIVPVVMEG